MFFLFLLPFSVNKVLCVNLYSAQCQRERPAESEALGGGGGGALRRPESKVVEERFELAPKTVSGDSSVVVLVFIIVLIFIYVPIYKR